VRIGPAELSDAGEVFTVQRAAYVTEAQHYGDPHLAPLTESLDAVRAAIAAGHVLVVRDGGRLVGAVRATVEGGTCHIGRLVVAPDAQGRGIGTALLAAVEALHAGRVQRFALFTGHRSEGNLRLYRAAGYEETHTVAVDASVTLVHLSKNVRP
jgi:ribosomal protein S18 acetylase RimI-like enzyme